MIVGICSVVFVCCSANLGIILAVVSLTLGIISLAGKKGGRGMAITGVVCSAVALFLGLLGLFFAPMFTRLFNSIYY